MRWIVNKCNSSNRMEYYPIELKLDIEKDLLSQSIKNMLLLELKDKLFIQSELKKLLDKPECIHCKLVNPLLTIEWISNSKVKLTLMKKVFKRILTLIHIYKLTQPIHIWFVPISSKRYFPKNGEMIDAEHINGGYTYISNKTIFVYRLEEFPKVMLHEVLHNTYLQTQFTSTDLTKLSKKLNISMKCNFQPAEAIIELWALYYHLKFISYEKNISFNELYYEELQWSLSQTKRLLDYKDKYYNEWCEKTNAISYIYIKTCLLFYLQDFLKIKTPYASSKLVKFIQLNIDRPKFVNAYLSKINLKDPSFKMTRFGDQ